MAQTVLVVGLSAASMAFITKLRSFDRESTIICFSGEPTAPYNRCLLADVLTGDALQQDILLKPDDFFENHAITVHLGTVVTAIDASSKKLLAGGTWYEYDRLFLGIGTRPFVPKNLWLDGVRGLYTFHTLADMHHIEQYIQQFQPRSAVVIGAGLNGMEAASSLVSKNISVTVIEAQAALLPGQVEPDVAQWVANVAVRHGVTIMTGRKAVSVMHEHDRVTGIVLDSGVQLEVDMIVLAAGSALNSDLVRDANIAMHQGSIVVSDHMQTSDPSILAGGDICVVKDFITKKLVRSTTWSDAMLQGLCAATTLSSTPRAYQGSIGLRDSYFFGIDFYACGDTTNPEYTKTVMKSTDQDLEILYTYQGVLRGFVLMGDVSKVPELKRNYVTQTKIQ